MDRKSVERIVDTQTMKHLRYYHINECRRNPYEKCAPTVDNCTWCCDAHQSSQKAIDKKADIKFSFSIEFEPL
jgi:hypothetical protein